MVLGLGPPGFLGFRLYIKGCVNWGSRTSILTSDLEFAGFLTTDGKYSSNLSSLAEILQHTDTKRIKYGQFKFMESLSPDDNAKSHLEHGTICCNINLKHNF